MAVTAGGAQDGPPRPRAFRALVVAHATATKNRAVREMGRSGVWLVAVLILLLVTTFLLPLWTMMLGVGWFLGKSIANPNAQTLLGAVLFGASAVGGALSGTLGGARQLTWESYRTYPVRVRTLFLAELLAGAADLVPIVLGVATACLLVGVGIAVPASTPMLVLLLVEGVLGVLVAQILVGSLAERAVRRLRVALGLLALAGWLGIALTAMIPAEMKAAGDDPLAPARVAALTRLLEPLRKIAAALPTTFGARSVHAWASGAAGKALLLHVYPATILLLASVWAARLLSREARGDFTGEGRPARAWSFGAPWEGVARLQFASVMGSRIGRFGLVVPLIVLVLVRGPLAQVVGQSAWTVPSAFVYVALVGNQFQLNQFGLDGHGVKCLFLLPIAERDLWRGKAVGFAGYHAIQAALLAGLMLWLRHTPVVQVIGGVLVFAALVFVQNGVGRRTSVWMPRMLPRRSVRGNATPIGLVFVGLGLSIAGGLLLGGTYVAAMHYAPALLVPITAGLLALAALFHRALGSGGDRRLRRGKEKILAALAGSEG